MNEPGIDLTGKLIIKVALGDDIRRILITNEDITYDELVLMMQRVYRGKLSSTDDILIKYRDEDGDLITIFDSSDLTFAIQCSRILKITLFVNSKPEPLQSNEVKMIKSEVKQIRDRCNSLLDRLDDRVAPDSATDNVDSTSTNKGGDKADKEAMDTDSTQIMSDLKRKFLQRQMITDSPKRPSPSPRSMLPPPTSAAGSKEFDPLSAQRSAEEQQNKVISSFGIGNNANTERAETPDSISSSHSASGLRPPQQGGGGSHPGTPGPQPSQQPAPYPTGSGQKPAPWHQQPQQQLASPAAPGQVPAPAAQYPREQAFSPVLAQSQDWHRENYGQTVMAGNDSFKPHSSRSYQVALMQSVQYTGHNMAMRSSPVPKQSTSTAPSTGFPTVQKTPSQLASQPSAFAPAQQAPSQYPTAQYAPGQVPASAPGQQMYSQPGQPAQQFPGPVQAVSGSPAGSQQPNPAQQQAQQQQQQQPAAYPYPGQQQQIPGQQPGQQPVQQPGQQAGQVPGSAQGPVAPGGGANPYARQGPGYGGYPRPSAGYPQGYQ